MLVSLVFGTKPNSIKAISGSAVMWLVALSSPLFGGTRGRREFAVPLTTSDFFGNATARRRQPESTQPLKARFQAGVSGVAVVCGTVRRLKAKALQPVFTVPEKLSDLPQERSAVSSNSATNLI